MLTCGELFVRLNETSPFFGLFIVDFSFDFFAGAFRRLALYFCLFSLSDFIIRKQFFTLWFEC